VVGGSVEFRIVGGTQQIPLAIARRLGPGAFLLNSPVRELDQDDTGVTVVSELATLRARRVIVAIPTCLTGFIRYNPILPADGARDLGRLSPAERKNRIVAEVATRFKGAGNLSTKITPNYFEFSSQDLEWIRGDYASTPGPRVLTASGFGPALRAPFGRIHWA